MELSALYVCPRHGLVDLAPPDPDAVALACGGAKEMGISRLWIPVLEEPLLRPGRECAAYLDGVVKVLDRLDAAGLGARLLLPAHRVLGLWVIPPYLARATPDPESAPALLAGRIRHLRPYAWWEDAEVVQKRIRAVREGVGALAGHPAIQGWSPLDEALGWVRPEPGQAELVFRAVVEEIRERDPEREILGGLGGEILLAPGPGRQISRYFDALRVRQGVEPPWEATASEPLGRLILQSVFVGALAFWLLGRSVHAEMGLLPWQEAWEEERLPDVGAKGEGLASLVWPTLMDPDPTMASAPPWVGERRLLAAGLLGHSGEPKVGASGLAAQVSGMGGREALMVPDLSREEFEEAPSFHLERLWNRFLEEFW